MWAAKQRIQAVVLPKKNHRVCTSSSKRKRSESCSFRKGQQSCHSCLGRAAKLPKYTHTHTHRHRQYINGLIDSLGLWMCPRGIFPLDRRYQDTFFSDWNMCAVLRACARGRARHLLRDCALTPSLPLSDRHGEVLPTVFARAEGDPVRGPRELMRCPSSGWPCCWS